MTIIALNGNLGTYLAEFVDSFAGAVARGAGSGFSSSSGAPYASSISGGGLFFPNSGSEFVSGYINGFSLSEGTFPNGLGGSLQFVERVDISGFTLDAGDLFELVYRTNTLSFGDFDESAFHTLLNSFPVEITGSENPDWITVNDWITLHTDDIFSMGAGNDRVDASLGNDIVHGGEGRDTLNGGAGNDVLHGDAGRDTLNGGAGSDVLHGGDKEDTLNGDAGNDTINGDLGDDILNGGDGSDTLNGGVGSDTLYGEGGHDTLNGGNKKDYIYGGGKNDTVSGGDGHDRLFGGGGSDVLDGGSGNDRMTGGDNADTFIYSSGGLDRIRDFALTEDALHLDDALWDTPMDLQQVFDTFGRIEGGDAVLDFGGDDVLTLNGVNSLGDLLGDTLII